MIIDCFYSKSNSVPIFSTYVPKNSKIPKRKVESIIMIGVVHDGHIFFKFPFTGRHSRFLSLQREKDM